MTAGLSDALDTYRRGLEAQLDLLETLATLAAVQHEACQRVDPAALAEVCHQREHVMDALAALEAVQRPVRDRIVAHLDAVRTLRTFAAVSELHRRAEACLDTVSARDNATLLELERSDPARRASAAALEAGEATLAAYRKTVSVDSRSSLVDSRG